MVVERTFVSGRPQIPELSSGFRLTGKFDPAPMFPEQGLHDIHAGTETLQRFILIGFHHLAEANHVGDKDDGNLANDRI